MLRAPKHNPRHSITTPQAMSINGLASPPPVREAQTRCTTCRAACTAELFGWPRANVKRLQIAAPFYCLKNIWVKK